MFLVSTTGDVFGGVTLGECAMNMQVYLGTATAGDFETYADTTMRKEYFPSVGCFVALNQTDCTSAYQTLFTSDLKFVQCVNQLGQMHAISNFEHQVSGLTPTPKTAASKSTVDVHVRVRKAEPQLDLALSINSHLGRLVVPRSQRSTMCKLVDNLARHHPFIVLSGPALLHL